MNIVIAYVLKSLNPLAKNFRELCPLFFIIFIDTFCWFIFAPILLKLYLPGPSAILPIDTTMSMRYFLYGLTMSLPPLAFIFASPFVGMASDLLGRKKTLLICLAASFLSFILPIYGIIKHLFSFILLGRLIGGASTTSQPVAQAAVSDCAKNTSDKSLYLSFIAFAMTLGLLLGPLTGGYLSNSQVVPWFSVKTPLYVGAILTTINIFLLLYGYRPCHISRKNHFDSVLLSLSLFKQLLKPRLLVFFCYFFSY